MLGVVTPVPYLVAVVLALATGTALCVRARRAPGRWTTVAARLIALVLAADAVSFVVAKLTAGTSRQRRTFPSLSATPPCWSPPPPAGGAPRFSSSSLFLGARGNPAGCDHSRFECRVPAPRVLPVPRRPPRNSPGGGLPRRRAAHRSTRGRCDLDLSHHRCLQRLRRPHRRAERGQLHVLAAPTWKLDPSQGARSVAVVHRTRPRWRLYCSSCSTCLF